MRFSIFIPTVIKNDFLYQRFINDGGSMSEMEPLQASVNVQQRVAEQFHIASSGGKPNHFIVCLNSSR